MILRFLTVDIGCFFWEILVLKWFVIMLFFFSIIIGFCFVKGPPCAGRHHLERARQLVRHGAAVASDGAHLVLRRPAVACTRLPTAWNRRAPAFPRK